MKRALSTPVLVTCALTALTLGATGCKLPSKKDKDAQAAAQADQKQAAQEQAQASKDAQAQAKAQAEEDARIDAATKDLEDKIRVYTAISGEFQGYYLKTGGGRNALSVTIAVNNLPTSLHSHRAQKESDVIAQSDALTLDVNVDEYSMDDQGNLKYKLNNCPATGLKPDLATGKMKFNCTSSGMVRHYELGLDIADSDFDKTTNPDQIELRVKRAADELAQGRIDAIGAFDINISSSSANLDGKILRKKPASDTE